MNTYQEDAARTSNPENKLDLDLVNLSGTDLLGMLELIAFKSADHDCLKRALFYSDAKVQARFDAAKEKALKTVVGLEARPDLDVQDTQTVNLIHSILGIAGEVGELAEELVKSKLENRELNRVNILEELGDIMWYISLAVTTLDSSFEEITTKNIDKLKVRYPEKFTKEKAINRDTTKELKALI